MENFRAKQYANFNFEGKVFSGGPCGCDYCTGECENCKEIIDDLKKDRDRYFKLWIRMGIGWVITMTSLFIVAFTK